MGNIISFLEELHYTSKNPERLLCQLDIDGLIVWNRYMYIAI